MTILPERNLTDVQAPTGIFVRAKDPNGQWVNADIWQLDRDSLIEWLRSRGGDNPWAEQVVCLLLGHER